MKKKLLSLLLVLVLVIGVTALAVMAEETTTPAGHENHCVCGGKTAGRGDHTECATVEWTALSVDSFETFTYTETKEVDGVSTEVTTTALKLKSGNYYLENDFDLYANAANTATFNAVLTNPKSAIWILGGDEVSICTNGHTLKHSQNRSINVNGVLNITDCSANGNGKFCGAGSSVSVAYVYSGGHINMYAGTVISNRGAKYDITSTGAIAVSDDLGRAEQEIPGSMTMYGGTIKCRDAGVQGSAGAVAVWNDATFVMYGGTIQGGNVKNHGGALDNRSASGVQLLGGKIKTGSAGGLGDCVYSTGPVTVGGSVQIDSVYLAGSATITTQNLTGMVGLEVAKDDFRVVGTTTEAEFAKLTSLMPTNHQLTYSEGNVAFAPYHADHCECGGNLSDSAKAVHTECTNETWIALTNENILDYLVTSDTNDGGSENYLMFAQNGSYYLAENIAIKKPIEIHNGDDINLCLNGYDWKYTKGFKLSAFRVWGNLNICDCVGTGVVSSNADNSGSVMFLHDSKATADYTVNIYGGTFTATNNDATKNGGVISIGNASAATTANATVNIFGGTITGGTAAQGGNIYMNQSADATGRVSLNIHGGEITNGTASTRGGNIYVNRGDFTMTGGSITGGTLVAETAQFGADFACGANTPMSATLNGKVTIGEIGAYGSSNNEYAIALGENFSTESVIKVSSSNLQRVIKSATWADYQWFAPASETAQLTLEGSGIFLRSVDDFYFCRCGGNLTAEAAEAIVHTKCEHVKFTALTADVLAGLTITENDGLGGNCYTLATGNYILTGDLNIDKALLIPATATVRLNLNGHNIIAGDGVNRAVIARGKLHLSDSAYVHGDENAQWGQIIGSATATKGGTALYVGYTKGIESYIYGGGLSSAKTEATLSGIVGVSGTLRMVGGQITGFTKTSGNGAAVTVNDNGIFHIYGGTILAGQAKLGGAIYANTADKTQQIYVRGDALITGGTAQSGGNIYAGKTASVYVYGGTIQNGTATGTTSGTVGGGGNIYAAGTLKITGGTITGGSATRTQSSARAYGGNIYQDNSAKTMTIQGGTIENGSAVTGGNIFVRATFVMSGGTITGGEATEAMAGNLRVEGNANNSVNITGGTISNGISEQQGANLVLRNLVNECVITDLTVTGGNCPAHHGGSVYITGQQGDLTMTNVSISGGTAYDRAGNLYITGGSEELAVVTLNNCTITDGTAGSRGGNIYIADVDATLNNCTVTGGRILLTGAEELAENTYGYNIATNVGNYASKLTINGGTYQTAGADNVSATSVHLLSNATDYTLTVAGAPVIDDLRLGTDRMLTVGELTEGADIGISRFEVAGVFAPGAAQYAQYFHSVEENVTVAAQGEDLVLVSSLPYWAYTAEHKAIGGAATIAEALQLENAAMIKLVADYETTETYEGDLYLDLNGYDLSGLTVNGNLYVVDYQTNNFEENVWGTFRGTVTGAINDGKVAYDTRDAAGFNSTNKYVKIVHEDGSMSFHRVNVSITHISLDPANDALGFKAMVEGDSLVQAAVTGYGFNMGVNITKAYTKTGAPADGMFSLRLRNILKNNGGEMTITGQPVVFFGEESVSGSTKNTTMKQTVEAVEDAVAENPEAYTETQISAVQALLAQYEEQVAAWDIDSIKAWVAPSTEPEETV